MTAPCNTATTGTLQNCTVSFRRWPILEVSKLSVTDDSLSSFRSSPAQKFSPAPFITTACTCEGMEEKNVCRPSTSSSLSELRFSGRFSVTTAIVSRISTRTHDGSASGQVQGQQWRNQSPARAQAVAHGCIYVGGACHPVEKTGHCLAYQVELQAVREMPGLFSPDADRLLTEVLRKAHRPLDDSFARELSADDFHQRNQV